jgi:RimJ/RimL family protein N-acetyltransferase
VPLTDGTVSLRYRRASDLDAISAASHDGAARRWPTDPPMDAGARAASLERVGEAFRSGRSAPLVIAESATDQPVGLINLQFRDDRVPAIAYSVFPGYRGKGAAPRAVRLMTGWAFAGLGLSELLLEIDQGNLASLRVAEKCGFQAAGRAVDQAPDENGAAKLVFWSKVTSPYSPHQGTRPGASSGSAAIVSSACSHAWWYKARISSLLSPGVAHMSALGAAPSASHGSGTPCGRPKTVPKYSSSQPAECLTRPSRLVPADGRRTR